MQGLKLEAVCIFNLVERADSFFRSKIRPTFPMDQVSVTYSSPLDLFPCRGLWCAQLQSSSFHLNHPPAKAAAKYSFGPTAKSAFYARNGVIMKKTHHTAGGSGAQQPLPAHDVEGETQVQATDIGQDQEYNLKVVLSLACNFTRLTSSAYGRHSWRHLESRSRYWLLWYVLSSASVLS